MTAIDDAKISEEVAQLTPAQLAEEFRKNAETYGSLDAKKIRSDLAALPDDQIVRQLLVWHAHEVANNGLVDFKSFIVEPFKALAYAREVLAVAYDEHAHAVTITNDAGFPERRDPRRTTTLDSDLIL